MGSGEVISINKLGIGGTALSWGQPVDKLRQSPFRWQEIQTNHVYSGKEFIGKITEKSKDRPT